MLRTPQFKNLNVFLRRKFYKKYQKRNFFSCSNFNSPHVKCTFTKQLG